MVLAPPAVATLICGFLPFGYTCFCIGHARGVHLGRMEIFRRWNDEDKKVLRDQIKKGTY